MSEKIETGTVLNEKVTTYTGTKDDGNKMTEKITLNKDTGEVSREVDGVKIEPALPNRSQSPKQVIVSYAAGNGEFIIVKLLDAILKQLKETNYYVRELAEKSHIVIDDEKVKEAINNG